uniref:Uncharacterized protein n=1 Tax=Rhabditophanes sp. KR3021 TaxID=114890 RepID=A0AC35U226_9BILA
MLLTMPTLTSNKLCYSVADLDFYKYEQSCSMENNNFYNSSSSLPTYFPAPIQLIPKQNKDVYTQTAQFNYYNDYQETKEMAVQFLSLCDKFDQQYYSKKPNTQSNSLMDSLLLLLSTFIS